MAATGASGLSGKMKIGLVISVVCAFMVFTLFSMNNSLVENSQNSMLRMIPQKIRVLYSSSQPWRGDDDFAPPPIKSDWNSGETEEQFQAEPKIAQPRLEHKVNEPRLEEPKEKEPRLENPKETEPRLEKTKEKQPALKEPEKEEPRLEEQKEESPIQEEATKQDLNADPTFHRLKGASTLKEALALVAPDKNVLLTLVDLSFHAMAVNFYLTCLKPFGISNYIILTMHPDTCQILEKHQINCFFYRDMSGGEVPSKWGTQIFKDKMNVRTEFVLDALKLDYSVLHTDIDMFCFKNVFKSVSCPRETCDISPLMDTFAYNAGFLFINPSPSSIAVYTKMKALSIAKRGMDDQAQLNAAMGQQKKQPTGLKVKKLPMSGFQCGVTYYENPKRYFADTAKPCLECVVVHNNWIVSMEAKVYRAKEMHQWMYDGAEPPGGYYTSTDAKYVRYDNVLANQDPMRALKSALAIADILNRTLILPTFLDAKQPKPLNCMIRLTPFDQMFKYREHSFSTHPRVPDSVKTSRSPMFIIASEVVAEKLPDVLNRGDVKVVVPKDSTLGMNDQEIREHFQDMKESILQFHSLHGAFSSFVDAERQKAWETKCASAFKKGQYRQYK